MHPCQQNPALSAHAALKGSYNFEATPMAPLGTKAFVHIKPNRHASWGFHAADAWYVGPALKHYWCAALQNTPTEAPPDYIDAVNRLQAVFKVRQQKQEGSPSSPQKENTNELSAQIQVKEKQITMSAKSDQTPKQPDPVPVVTQDEGIEEILTPNSAEPEQEDSLPSLITPDYDFNSNEEEDDEQPKQPRYNFRQCVRASANGIIFEESPNVTTSEG